MARMYPAHAPDDTKSRAEKKLFEILRADLGEEWAVLHSLGLAIHERKPWAEIDFVLVGPPGVFCLEVKGGRVARRDGRWHFTNGAGETTIKDEGPFEQVAGAAAALTHHLHERLPELRSAAIGFGVATPDIAFDADGPDIVPAIIYDARDRGQSFEAYARRLATYWCQRLEAQRHGRSVTSLERRAVEAVVKCLRRDFDLRPSLRSLIDQTNEDLLRLTNEQHSVMRGLRDNPRVLVQGGAGTGKTLLAIEEARVQADLRRRVLYCCFNRRLARSVRAALWNYPGIEVRHLHGLMAARVSEAGMRSQLPQAEEADLHTIFYPALCLEALAALSRVQEYDVLIIDEAQDLARDAYLEVFDALIKGGLSGGGWNVFLDPYQDLFNGIAPEGLARLMSAAPARYHLSVNCRNTKPIATAVALLSGVDCDSTLVVDGLEVKDLWYRDEAHQRRLMRDCLNQLLSNGARPEDIVILSRRRLELSSVRDGLPGVPYPIVPLDDDHDLGSSKPAIQFSTIGAYKGLEANIALVIDIDELSSPDTLRALYVGASRARAVLVTFFAERCKDEYAVRARDFGRRLARQGQN